MLDFEDKLLFQFYRWMDIAIFWELFLIFTETFQVPAMLGNETSKAPQGLGYW